MSKLEDTKSLILSLSLSEKRYFKLYSNLFKKDHINSYNILFDIIEHNIKQAESKIITSFAKKTNKEQRFSYTLNYLYDLILKSLSAYRLNKQKSSKLRYWADYTEILIEKSLEQQALKVIKKGIKLSQKENIIENHLEFLFLRDVVWNRLNFKPTKLKELETSYVNKLKLLEECKLVCELQLLGQKLFLSLNNNVADAKEDLFVRFKSLIASFKAKINTETPNYIYRHFLILNSQVYIFTCRYNEALNSINSLLELHKKGKQKNELELLDHLHVLNLKLICTALTGRDQEFYNTQQKIKDLDIANSRSISLKFASKLISLVFYSINGDQDTFVQTLINCRNELDSTPKLKMRSYQEYVINYWTVYEYLMSSKFEEGYELTYKLLQQSKEQEEFYQYLKIFQLIFAYELNYDKYIYTTLPTTKKYIVAKGCFLDQKYVLSGINALMSERNVQNKLDKLITKVKKLEQTNFSVIGKQYFVTQAWLLSKKDNIPLSDAVKIWYQDNSCFRSGS